MKEFLIAAWSWLVTPVGEPDGAHTLGKAPRTLEGGRYRGRHRAARVPKSTPEFTPEAGAWFAQHRADFAQAYARVQGRVA